MDQLIYRHSLVESLVGRLLHLTTPMDSCLILPQTVQCKHHDLVFLHAGPVKPPPNTSLHMDGWMNQAYSRLSTTHGHITDCKLLCMYGTRLVLVRPAASFYSASPACIWTTPCLAAKLW